MAPFRLLLFFCLLVISHYPTIGQEQSFVLTGKIAGPDGQPIQGVNIQVINSRQGTFSDHNGVFKIRLNLSKDSILIFTALNYERIEINMLRNGGKALKVLMHPVSIPLSEVEINEQRKSNPGIVNIDPHLTKNLTSTGGGCHRTTCQDATRCEQPQRIDTAVQRERWKL